jgi:hypothetical protein
MFAYLRVLARLLCLVCLASGSTTALSQGKQIAGVTLQDSITIYNNELRLNGAGLYNVDKSGSYVVQIFAKQKFGSLDEFLAGPGPKRLRLTAVKTVDVQSIVKAFNRNLEDANRADMAKLVPGMMAVGNAFNTKSTLAPGDVLMVDWITIYGMTIYINGKKQFEALKPPELFKALAGVWLRDTAADTKLKDALLGK